MPVTELIEAQLRTVIDGAQDPRCPPAFAQALEYAVFPGGGRIRPKLCIAVAHACGLTDPVRAAGSGAAVELIHCASLVHDDLPCFDDADVRRGKPSVHRAYGEPTAVLVGDTLIVLGFEMLAHTYASAPRDLAAAVSLLAGSAGVPAGIAAGQAWECERSIDLEAYHDAKTGALFAVAAALGALSAGRSTDGWWRFGTLIGRAYQAVDDMRDRFATAAEIGKPTGQDQRQGRPNCADGLAPEQAMARVRAVVEGALDAMPPCPGAAQLRALVVEQMDRVLPAGIALELEAA